MSLAEEKQKQKLSLVERQSALFKLLRKICDELFAGIQKRLAACLHIDPSTLSRWFSQELCAVNPDLRGNDYQVIIHLIAVHRSLSSIFSNPEDRRAWFTSANADLRGESPEQLMRSGLEGLIFVRQYLDYVRGVGA